jgi:hypothetical protein
MQQLIDHAKILRDLATSGDGYLSQFDIKRLHSAADAIESAALPAAHMGVKVKPLVWRRADLSAWGEYADAGVIRYRMTWTYRNEPEVWFVMRCEHDGKTLYEGGDEDAAIAAANADCAARILAALTPSPAPTLRDALELVEENLLAAIDAKIEQWEEDDDLADWVSPAKTIRAEVVATLAALQKGGVE